MEVLFDQNDMLIEVLGARDATAAAGTYLNSKTCEVTLKDSHLQKIAGETWPLAMGYVAASDGDYRGTLKDTLVLPANRVLKAEVVFNGGTGLQARWDLNVQVKERG